MSTRPCCTKYLLTAVVFVQVALGGARLAAQEKSWVGETVLHTRPAEEIKFVDTVGGKEVRYAFTGTWPFTVRAEKDGKLRIHDRKHEGWVDKADFVLAHDAVAYFTRRIETNPRDFFALKMRGAAYLQKHAPDKAIVDFDLCLKIKADSTAFNSRGLAWQEKKEYDKSIADFTEAIQLNPKNIIQWVNRAVVWRLKSNYDKSIADCDAALKLDVHYPIAWFHRGFALLFKKDYDGAIKDFDESIRQDPKFPPAYAERSIAWRSKKDYDKAIKDCDEALRLDPKYAFAYYCRGIVWQLSKEYDKAIKDYDQAIHLNPKDAQWYYERALSWRSKKGYEQAIKDYNEAIHLNPKYANAYQSRGLVYRTTKQYEKAIKDYDEAIRLDAKQNFAYSQLSWLLSTCPEAKYRDGKRAVSLATKACELSKSAPSDLDILAAAHAEVGEFDLAVKFERQALESAAFQKQSGAAARARLKEYEQKQPHREK